MAGTRDLLALAAAERRRLAGCLAGGWALFALVYLLAMTDLGCPGCPPGSVERFLGLKVLLFCLLYAMAPVVVCAVGPDSRGSILIGLPLSRAQANLVQVYRAAAVFLCCLPVWALLAWRLPAHGILVEPWLFVFAALAVILYVVGSLAVNVFWRAAVAAAVPLLIFPPSAHTTFRGALAAAATPWPSLAILFLILAAAPPLVVRSRLRTGRSAR